MVRTNALLTIIVTAVAIATQLWAIMALLALDFFVRGFFNPRNAALSTISAAIVGALPFTHKSIYFPPKQFAARVGLVFALTSALLLWAGLHTVATVVMGTLVLFATLECFFNICMGCIVFNAFLTVRRRLTSS